MRLLLDTHVLLWLAQEPRRVPLPVQEAVESADERHVGAASAYEIAFKARRGKLPHGRVIMDGWELLLRTMMARELALSAADMAHAGGLEWSHRDPFDRMLVAQAQRAGLVLVTADERIREFENVRTLWA
ncbi:MAG: type II toxin-antitoxin system VapC family toxin [Aeromicrobium sp.]|uniref:type II toxin-antitoxin system VapC family toxin n=1 Tax=Aeromicrobium sp. TaxID=1871063 RepID=UPI0039E4A35F